MSGNIFKINEFPAGDFEKFETVASFDSGEIERIVSAGQTTPAGKWLEQDRNEWVVLLKGNARLDFENDEEVELNEGDHISIPSGTRHRVTFTSSEPPCIWLAVHYD